LSAALAPRSEAQLTTTSPAGGTLPSGVTVVGGIVTDLKGVNGNHVVSQISASSLFTGFASTNPFDIGSLGGFSSGVLSALGGGISSAAFRFSLYDGDTACPSNFDCNRNTLLVNGSGFGTNNWSTVATQRTSSTGTTIGGVTQGFQTDQLMTGWFFSSDAMFLNSLYASLSATGTLRFSLFDQTPGDNFYDFTQGIDASLIDVGQPPVVTPPTTAPEPATMTLLATGLIGVFGVARRRRRQS
jgi:hypothetical protein